jgi:ketosteroid isomerase-like protein
MEHPNATKMRKTVAAFTAGDLPLMLEAFAPDVVWYAPGHTPASGTFRGLDGVRRFFTLLDDASAGSIQVEIEDILAGDRYVTMFLTITARRHEERMSVLVAQFAEADEHGRWSRGWFLPDKLDEWDRFFAAANSGRH